MNYLAVFCVLISCTSSIPLVVGVVQCPTTGILCLNATTFTSCLQIINFAIVQTQELSCPVGFECNENSLTPCVPEFGNNGSFFNMDNVKCPVNGIKCVDSTTFTSCLTSSNSVLLSENHLSCPTGFVCREDTVIPCVPAPTTTSPKPSSVKPVDPPRCYGHSFHEGPTCNQYYECVSFWWLWWNPVLKYCALGEHFNLAISSCIPASDSDCID